MRFEKALEAMKQGKKITCKGSEFYYSMSGENEIHCVNFVIGYETTVKFFCSDILSDKWETYEEPQQEEPEMTAEKAVEWLKEIKHNPMVAFAKDVHSCSDALDFAIKALENQNRHEKECECECTVHPVEWFTATLECTETDNSEIINELKKEVRETIEREIRRIYYAEKVGLI